MAKTKKKIKKAAAGKTPGKRKAATKKKAGAKKKSAPKRKAAKKAAPKVAAKPARMAPKAGTTPLMAMSAVSPPPTAAAPRPAMPKPAMPKPAPAKPLPPRPAPPRPAPALPSPSASGGISAADVNLGHVAALRPRTHTGFKPEAFQEAKRVLVGVRYATIEEAARAVAEKAVELSNESGPAPFTPA